MNSNKQDFFKNVILASMSGMKSPFLAQNRVFMLANGLASMVNEHGRSPFFIREFKLHASMLAMLAVFLERVLIIQFRRLFDCFFRG